MESNYYIKVKTGFFKTIKYKLIVKKNLIELIPEKSEENEISLKENEIVSIFLRKKDKVYVDFNLKEGGITGTILNIKDAQKIFKLFKENMNKNIIYEED